MDIQWVWKRDGSSHFQNTIESILIILFGFRERGLFDVIFILFFAIRWRVIGFATIYTRVRGHRPSHARMRSVHRDFVHNWRKCFSSWWCWTQIFSIQVTFIFTKILNNKTWRTLQRNFFMEIYNLYKNKQYCTSKSSQIVMFCTCFIDMIDKYVYHTHANTNSTTKNIQTDITKSVE